MRISHRGAGPRNPIRRIPRKRRQVGPVTLRVAKVFGFRYDAPREAYVLRLVGNYLGPVIRSGAVDSAARTIEWSHDMDELASVRRKKPGRFMREPQDERAAERDLLNR